MKKSCSYTLMVAVLPLLFFSCAKEVPVADVATETTEIQSVDPWTPVPLTEVPALPGSHSVLAGFGDDTKASLDMNGAGTHAGVVWDAGDSFVMIGYDVGSYQYANYSTSTAGAKVDFTTGFTITRTSNKLHSLAPSSAFGGLRYLGSVIHMRATIPTDQVATAGDVDPAAQLAYALSDTQDEDLHFKNLSALIKFRLSGDVVSQVKKVTFRGIYGMAGTGILSLGNADSPSFVSGYFSDRAVNLNGDFTTGVDYYIAVAPCLQDGFTMTFYNDDGTKSIKKVSSKELTLNRAKITDFGTIDLGDAFPAADPTPTPYIAATVSSPLKPVSIVVIPDGYTSAQLDDFEADAKSGIDAMFATEPYKTFKNYFNVWILKVASNESGARITDGTTEEQNRDCYFRSAWASESYSSMGADADRVFAFVEDNCPDILDGTHDITEVAVLLIINDSRYGGISHYYDNGKTYCMVPTTSGTLSWSYANVEAFSVDAAPGEVEGVNIHTLTTEEKNDLGHSTGTWRNTLVHEFGGHSFGRLSDEYWYSSYYPAVESIYSHSWSVPFGLNLSAKSSPTPWDMLLEASNNAYLISLDATKYGRIGVYQGGGVSRFNRWRSEKVSCMIDNRFYFSTWQRYLIVQRILTLANHTVGSAYTPVSLSFSDFVSNDEPTDPLRDGGSPVKLPDGLVNSVPPRPVPLLPPPVLLED